MMYSEDLPDALGYLQVNGLPKEFVLLLSQYLKGMETYSRNCGVTHEDPNSIQNSIKRAVEEQKMISIRLARAKDSIRQVRIAEDVLKSAARHFKLKLEVLINDSDNSKIVQFDYQEHEDKVLRRAQNRDKSITLDKMKKNLQFSDFEGIPIIMLIVCKGRMGDTFPPCVRFDLSTRYKNQVRDFTALIQVSLLSTRMKCPSAIV